MYAIRRRRDGLALTMAVGLTAALIVAPTGFGVADAGGDGGFVVVAAQTQLRLWQTAEEFAEHMSERIEAAMAHNPDLIALPEDIGLPLVCLGDADIVAEAESIEEAIGGMLMRHREAVGALAAEHGVSPQRALWLAKAAAIRAVYVETFSALAREHGVYIVAGSVPMVLPDRPADALNTACVFDPEGGMHVVGTKVNLVPLEQEEGLDLTPGSLEDYRVFRLPEASVGVIVCADGWDPEIASALVEQGAQVLVQVSANPEVWTDGTREGWQDSLLARVQELSVYGVCVMGVGDLLGLPVQGRSSVVAPRAWTDDGSGFLSEAASATDEEIVAVSLDLGRVARD